MNRQIHQIIVVLNRSFEFSNKENMGQKELAGSPMRAEYKHSAQLSLNIYYYIISVLPFYLQYFLACLSRNIMKAVAFASAFLHWRMLCLSGYMTAR